MSDWTEKEYKDILTYKSEGVHGGNTSIKPVGETYVPVDWRNSNCMNHIVN